MGYALFSLTEDPPPGFVHRANPSRIDLSRTPFALFSPSLEMAMRVIEPCLGGAAGVIVTFGAEIAWRECAPSVFHFVVPSDLNDRLAPLVCVQLDLIGSGRTLRDRHEALSLERGREIEDKLRVKEEFGQVKESLLSEISRRKHSETRLHETTEMLRRIIDTIPHFVFWKNRDLVYVGANERFGKAGGLKSSGDIAGKTDFDLPWGEQASLYRADDKRVMDLDEPLINIVEPQTRADGSLAWLETSKAPLHGPDGKVTGVLGIYQDITERKAVEGVREQMLGFIETLLQRSPMGISVYEGESGVCVLANLTLADMVGAPVDVIRNQNFRDLGSWESSGLRAIADAVLSDGVTRKTESGLTSSFGRKMVIDGFLSRFEFSGKPHLMFIATDISDRKRLEDENRRIEAQLLQVRKLESIGTLAGGIAHDFNNILTAIVGYTALELSKAPEGSRLRDSLIHVSSAGQRAAELVRQILTFSRQGQLTLKPVCIGPIVHETMKLMRAAMPATIGIRLEVESDATVLADATQIQQVVMNLGMNASKAMGEDGGSIRIALDEVVLDDFFAGHHPDILPGRFIRLQVSDTGCGMSPEVIQRIFDPFFTTRPQGEGTGLGLSVVHGIVSSYRGTVTVESRPGAGSIFNVYLPIVDSAAEQEGSGTSPALKGDARILIVDDELPIVNLVLAQLRELGYRVEGVTDSLEAFRVFEENPDGFDLVLTDLTMPGMTGEVLARKMKRIRGDIPIILCSGYSAMLSPEKYRENGIDELMTKPYTVERLSEVIARVLDSHR